MHMVHVTVEIDAARSEEAVSMLHEQVVPSVKASAGFVSGTWARSADGTTGHGFELYADEASAKAAVEEFGQNPPPAGAPVKPVSVEILEVMAQA